MPLSFVPAHPDTSASTAPSAISLFISRPPRRYARPSVQRLKTSDVLTPPNAKLLLTT
jgi:hypothetical protein